MKRPILLKEVEFNFGCPFHYEEDCPLSDVTAGSNSMCAFLDEDCCGLGQKKCPLKENIILIDMK